MTRPANPCPLDVARVESLIDLRLAGAVGAEKELTAHLCAFLLPALSKTRLLARGDEDAPREVMIRVVDKLQREDGRALASFKDWRARHSAKTIQDWLMIVMTNAAREYVRLDRGRRGPTDASRTRVMNELVELTEANEPGARPAMTPLQTARAIIEYARAHLPKEQLDCLERWLEGQEFDEIATAMALGSNEEAQRHIRAAIAALRRHYAERPTRKEPQ